MATPLPDRPPAPGAGFSPFRRHRTARALSAYVLAELHGGRVLPEILEDGYVDDCTSEHPGLLEELAWDQEILAAIKDRARPPRPCGAPATRRRRSASPAVPC